MLSAVLAAGLLLPSAQFPNPVELAVRQVSVPGVTVLRVDRTFAGARIIGSAAREADLAELKLVLQNLVQTPLGMGRIHKRKGTGGAQVALLAGDAGVVYVAEADLTFLELTVRTAPLKAKQGGGVSFDLRLEPKK
jgi:hypothetical protein